MFKGLLLFQLVQEQYGRDIPLFVVAHSMGGMVALRAAISHPDFFKGMVLNGPLIIPGKRKRFDPNRARAKTDPFTGPQWGPIDFRVTSLRASLVRCILGTLSWLNPRLILGSVNMDLISRDEEVKRALALDNKRWDKGCKVRSKD